MENPAPLIFPVNAEILSAVMQSLLSLVLPAYNNLTIQWCSIFQFCGEEAKLWF